MTRVRFIPRRVASRFMQAVAVGLMALLPASALQAARERVARQSRGERSRFDAFARGVVGLLRFAGIPPTVEAFTVVEGPSVVRLVRCDSQIAARLYWRGSAGWEPELAPYWRAACSGANRIMELGANIGYFSVIGGLATSGQYFAVEPHPVSAAILRKNIDLNGLDDTVHAIQAAASPHEGHRQVALNVPVVDRYGAPAGAFVDPEDQIRENRTSLLVETIPIAELLDGSDLIKMDVEGMEAVLIGASLPALLTFLPTIFLEVLDANAPLREIIYRILTTSSYRAFVPVAGGLTELNADESLAVRLQGTYGTRDLILTTDPTRMALL